jgi:hypothetical protein
MPAVWLVAAQRRSLVLQLWLRVEYVRHRRYLSGVSSPVDFNPVSVVRWLVVAFRLVCAVNQVPCGGSAVYPVRNPAFHAILNS